MDARALTGLFVACLAPAVGLTACERKAAGPDPRSAGDTGASPAATAPDGGGLAWKVLEKLDARIEVPAGCAVDDTSSEGRPASYSIYDARGFFSVMVRGANEADPASLLAAKKALPARTFTRAEEFAGGWVMQWEERRGGEMDETLHGVDVLRGVGGQPVRCSRALPSKDAAAAVVKSCLSLSAR